MSTSSRWLGSTSNCWRSETQASWPMCAEPSRPSVRRKPAVAVSVGREHLIVGGEFGLEPGRHHGTAIAGDTRLEASISVLGDASDGTPDLIVVSIVGSGVRAAEIESVRIGGGN